MICRDNTSYMFHLWRWHFRHGNWIDRLRIVAFNIECFSFSQKFEKSLDYLLYPKPLSHSSSFLGFLQHNTAESLAIGIIAINGYYPNGPSSIRVSCFSPSLYTTAIFSPWQGSWWLLFYVHCFPKLRKSWWTILN